jgi:hypothetical protein
VAAADGSSEITATNWYHVILETEELIKNNPMNGKNVIWE